MNNQLFLISALIIVWGWLISTYLLRILIVLRKLLKRLENEI